MKRIHLISGPRNLSTALMYAFKSRPDCTVIDEPLYAHYLTKNNELCHPGKSDIIKSMSSDLATVLAQRYFAYYPTSELFIKDMAHHFKDLNYKLLTLFENIFLIRDLKKLILSFSKVIAQPSLQDIGIKLEYDQYRFLEQRGIEAPVINSDLMLQDPPLYLECLCNKINISYTSKMLTWNKGGIPEDGIWAKYWYNSIHNSNGFIKKQYVDVDLPDHLQALYIKALPYYDYLNQKSLQI